MWNKLQLVVVAVSTKESLGQHLDQAFCAIKCLVTGCLALALELRCGWSFCKRAQSEIKPNKLLVEGTAYA